MTEDTLKLCMVFDPQLHLISAFVYDHQLRAKTVKAAIIIIRISKEKQMEVIHTYKVGDNKYKTVPLTLSDR
jgi:hypothetical protein